MDNQRYQIDIIFDNLSIGNLMPLKDFLNSNKGPTPPEIIKKILEIIKGKDDWNFSLTRADGLTKGQTIGEQWQKYLKDQAIVDHLVLGGAFKRGQMQVARFNTAKEFNIKPDTVKKLYQEVFKELRESARKHKWRQTLPCGDCWACRQNEIPRASLESREPPENWQPKEPINIKEFMVRQAKSRVSNSKKNT